MRELQSGGDVTHGEHAGNIGAQALVDEHPAPLHRHALLLEAHVGRVRSAADGHQQELGIDLLAVLERDVHARVVLRRGGEADAEAEVDLALAERALEGLRAGLVLVGDQMGECLDDRHVGSEGLPDGGELHADDATSEHDDALGHVVEVEGLVGRHDAPADLESRQALGVRPGREDDVLARVALAVDLDRVRRHESPGALDEGHIPALDQALQALVQPTDDPVAILVHLRHVDAVEGGPHAEGVTLLGAVGDLRGVQQCLRRDAAAMQAGAAELVLVDQDDGHPEFCCPQGAGVAAAAAAEDYQVCIGHCRPLQSRGFAIVT